jgi:Ca2+-binding EF-hand superfamily protein
VAYFLRQVTEEKKNRRVAQASKELSKRVNKSAREEERLKDERGSPDYGFDEDFRRDTLWRLSNFAGRYERFSASAVSLDPFYGLEMTPAVLRQTLFRIVGIRLSNKELGVLVREFAKPDTDVVHSSEFLLAFLRAGVEQREVWHKAKAEKQQERERKVKAELAYTKEHGEKESEVGAVDHAFTAADSASARDKLVRASLAYDKLSSTAPSLQVFESGVMTASKLRDNLRKVFNVYLSARELGAVMKDFDAKGEGYVRSRDFVRGFLRLGTEKRAEVQRQNVSSRARSPTTKQSTEKEGPTSEETVADWRFEPEHFDAAAAKLETALLHGDATGMAALNGIRMNPVELQTFLQKSLRVALDPLELGALMNRVGVSLSVESTSRAAVDSLVLKGLLLRLRHTAKAKEQQKMNADKRRLREEEEARVHRLALLEEQRPKASSEYFFSEEDRVQALSRLSAVAMKYDKSSPGSVSLEGFRRAFLSPAEFVQTLRLTFNLALDQKEASALVEQFEYKDSGSLDCAAFVNAFIKVLHGAQLLLCCVHL